MNNLLYKTLNINPNKKEVISFVGAGGKTTSIFKLAKELKALDKKILITTTTKIFIPDKKDFDHLFLEKIINDSILPSSITIFCEEIIGNKLGGLNKENLEEIIQEDIFDFYLIESDGANSKPIKAPSFYEPIIVNSTSKTVGLVGLDALNEKFSEISHRSEILIDLLNKKLTDSIETRDIVNLALDKNGLFKNAKGESILILNKAINQDKIELAKTIREDLSNYNFENVIIANILTDEFY